MHDHKGCKKQIMIEVVTEVEDRLALYNWLTGWLIHIWVRALTVPMHLGLINRPSVPH